MKGLSHTYTRIHFPPNSPPIQAATWHWAEFPVLYGRSLLGVHVKCSCLYMSIPNSLTIPCPILPAGNHKLLLSLWVCFCFVSKFICITSFWIPHIRDVTWYFSFSDLLRSVWHSLGPPMLLQRALLHSFYEWLSNSPLCICTTSLSIPLLMDI